MRPNIKDPDPATQTELQQRKTAFVKDLCERAHARTKSAALLQCAGESRLAAVQRVMAEGARANEGNPWCASDKRRDKLRAQLGYWWALGADATVLYWIGFGVELQFMSEPPTWYFPNHMTYHEHMEHVCKEHEQHLEDGSYRVMEAAEVKAGNPLQVEVNAKGKCRTCEDARAVNAYMANYDFTQETVKEHVAGMLRRGMVMITTDVEKAYYQVPLHKKSQAYLAWQHAGQWIVPTVLTFGIKPAPFIFTKIMWPILRYMRGLGILHALHHLHRRLESDTTTALHRRPCRSRSMGVAGVGPSLLLLPGSSTCSSEGNVLQYDQICRMYSIVLGVAHGLVSVRPPLWSCLYALTIP